MSIMDTETLAAPPPRSAPHRFKVTDVTENLVMDAELQSTITVGDAARTLAQRMELPTDVPWALRDDRGAFLDDDGEIGEKIAADAKVTLTPRTHLG